MYVIREEHHRNDELNLFRKVCLLVHPSIQDDLSNLLSFCPPGLLSGTITKDESLEKLFHLYEWDRVKKIIED